MKACFSLSDIESIKREVALALPDVKSSHRVEAMARGLGWNTNAALRAELTRQPADGTVDDKAFRSYLKEHGFVHIPVDVLDEAVVRGNFSCQRAAIKAAMDREPTLTRFGFGVFGESKKSPEQRRQEFKESREALLTLDATDEFIRACEFLSHFPRRRTINEKVSSYGLKHRAEHFHRDRGIDYEYVSNGALIAAAIHLGFNIRQNGPNALLNIGAKQDSQLPPASAPGKRLPPPRPRAAKVTLRFAAWRNTMIAAINAGLDQKIFSLDAGDNRWTGERAVYPLAIAGIPALASVGDAGFGELVFVVAVNPRKDASEFIEPFTRYSYNLRFQAGDGCAEGWLERRNGKWLQTGANPSCHFRRELVPTLAEAVIKPNGYLPEGRVMM